MWGEALSLEEISKKCYTDEMVSKLLKSNGVRQLLGALGGMTVAAMLYYSMDLLPISKALLIGSSSPIAQNGKQVSINEKNVDPDTFKADQSGSSSSETVARNQLAQSAVVDSADSRAWVAMRAAQKARNQVHTAPSPNQIVAMIAPAASSSISSFASSIMFAQEISELATVYQAPTVVDTGAMPTVPSARLPDSGLGLNLLMFASFIFTIVMLPAERKRALIAALRFEH